MHTQICEFPSKTLYSSKLSAHESVASHLLRDLPNANEAEDEDAVLNTPVVFFDTAGCEYFERLEGQGEGASTDAEGSRCNENEATLVKAWVDKLVRKCASLTPKLLLLTKYADGNGNSTCTNCSYLTVRACI
jgi:DNA polymerase alpha-associated DNA helicase A